MYEAARTYASPTAIWVIVIVMTCVTAFMVGACAVADSVQARIIRRTRLGGTRQWTIEYAEAVGAGAGGQYEGQTAEMPPRPVPAQTSAASAADAREAAATGRHRRPGTDPTGETSAQGVPEQSPTAPGRHALPRQRGGDTDRAERSYSGPDRQEGDDSGRS